MIVIFHVVGINQLVMPSALSFIPSYFGFGVPLFFIISSFSLFYTYFRRLSGPGQVGAYLARRFARIAPLFYAMIAVWLVTAHYKFRQPFNSSELVANLAFIFNFVPAWETSLVWAGWSIGVEFLFYALLPMLVAFVRSTRASVVTLAACLVLAWSFQRSPTPPSYSFFKYGPFFAMGVLAWHFFDQRINSPARKRLAFGSLLAATLLTALMVCPGPVRAFLWSLSYKDAEFYLLGGVLMLLVYSQAAHPVAAISNRVTQFLGEISFSLYLLHPWIILMCKPVYVFLAARLSPGLCFFVSTAFTFGVLVPVAWLSYRTIEVPGMALGKSWVQRQGATAKNPAPAGIASRKPSPVPAHSTLEPQGS